MLRLWPLLLPRSPLLGAAARTTLVQIRPTEMCTSPRGSREEVRRSMSAPQK
jgi:hypothetical protein